MHQIVELILFPFVLAWGLFLDILCMPVVGFLWVKDQCAGLFKYACWHLSYYAHDKGWRAWEFRLRRWAGRKMTLGEYFGHLRAALRDRRARLRPRERLPHATFRGFALERHFFGMVGRRKPGTGPPNNCRVR